MLLGGLSAGAVLTGIVFGIVYLAFAVAVVAGILPSWALLTLMSIPIAIRPMRTIFTTTEGPPLIGVLKNTARLQLVFAVLLAVGVLIG